MDKDEEPSLSTDLAVDLRKLSEVDAFLSPYRCFGLALLPEYVF